MLKETQMSITDIALAVGFSDGSHFCRMFQKEFRLSPSAYRHAHHTSAAHKFPPYK